jgi:hypothetical protein
MPKVPLSTAKSAITLGAMMPSNCWSIPSQVSTSMQMTKVAIWNARNGARSIASLNVVAIGLPSPLRHCFGEGSARVNLARSLLTLSRGHAADTEPGAKARTAMARYTVPKQG